MDRRNLQNLDANRSHEPVGIPLNRPPGTFSPTGGEGRDEGVRFMERRLVGAGTFGGNDRPAACASATTDGRDDRKEDPREVLAGSSPLFSPFAPVPIA